MSNKIGIMLRMIMRGGRARNRVNAGYINTGG